MKTPRFLLSIAFGVISALALAGPKTLLQRNATLLTSPYVTEELKFNAAQTAKRIKIIETYNEKVARIGADTGVKEGASENYRNALDAADMEFANNLIGLLGPAQTKRMKQLALQAEGIDGLRDPNVATELGLSAAQKPKVAALFASTDKADEAYQVALGDALEKIPTPGDSPAEMKEYEKKQAAVLAQMKPKQKQFQALKFQNESKIMAIFTPAQKAKWKAMLGKPLPPR